MACQDTETIANLFIDHWVNQHGTPHCLYSDKGASYESQVFQSRVVLGIKKTRTTPGHLPGNTYQLSQSLFPRTTFRGLESSPWQSTDCLSSNSSHTYLAYRPKLVSDSIDFVASMSEDFKAVHELARKNAEKAYKTQKAYYDQNSSSHGYKVGGLCRYIYPSQHRDAIGSSNFRTTRKISLSTFYRRRR